MRLNDAVHDVTGEIFRDGWSRIRGSIQGLQASRQRQLVRAAAGHRAAVFKAIRGGGTMTRSQLMNQLDYLTTKSSHIVDSSGFLDGKTKLEATEIKDLTERFANWCVPSQPERTTVAVGSLEIADPMLRNREMRERASQQRPSARIALQQVGQRIAHPRQLFELFERHRQQRPAREEVGVRVDQRALGGAVSRAERHVGRDAVDGPRDRTELLAQSAAGLRVDEVERQIEPRAQGRVGGQIERLREFRVAFTRQSEDEREDRRDAEARAVRDALEYRRVGGHALLAALAHGARG